MATFRIATFVNDESLYAGMRASFEEAGFVEPLARYTIEEGEPFSAISRLGKADEPFVILVHQDVLCDLGHTSDDLERRLAELTALDPRWAVAGNAGGAYRNRGALYVHINDPNGRWRTDGLPRRVRTLDENLLVLRTERRPRCSPDLSGFHCYGADVCLNADRDGSTAYVVDFLVTHLSAGNWDGTVEARDRLVESWSRRRTLPLYAMSVIGPLAIAKTRPLRWFLGRTKVRRAFLRDTGRILSEHRPPEPRS